MSKDFDIRHSNAGNIFLGVLAIATIRDFIEISLKGRELIDPLNPSNSLKTYFLHFNSFYFLVFVSLSLILYFFARKKTCISECFKIGALAMALIWLGPLFDYFAFGHFDMTYPSDPLFVVCNLHHFVDPNFSYEGLSKGMRLEIILAGLGGMGYIYYKTKKIIRSVCGGICLSATCLAIGLLIPFITQYYEYGLNFGYHKLYNSTLLHQGFVVHGAGCKIALFYIFLCIILFSLAYYIRSHNRFFAIIRNMRWTRSLHYLVLFGAGIMFIYHNPPIPNPSLADYYDYLATIWNHPIDLFGIFMASVAIFLSFQSAVIFNDIYDYGIDEVSNADRPLVTKAISQSEYRLIGRSFAILALTIAFCIHETFFFFVLLYQMMAFLYSAPPFRLRNYFIASNLELAIIFLVTLHAGTTVLIPEYRFENVPHHITFGFIICYALALVVKDFKDYEGDKKSNVHTLYTLFGIKIGNFATAILVCCATLLTPLLLHLSQLIVFSGIVCILFLLAITFVEKRNIKEMTVTSLYFIYVLTIFYFLIFQQQGTYIDYH